MSATFIPPLAPASPREKAEAAIGYLIEAGDEMADAFATVQALEDERPLIKARCIEQMLGTPNPLGKPGAVHSASSAAEVVEQNELYWNHRQKQAMAEVAKHRATASFAAWKLRARLAVAIVEADGAL